MVMASINMCNYRLKLPPMCDAGLCTPDCFHDPVHECHVWCYHNSGFFRFYADERQTDHVIQNSIIVRETLTDHWRHIVNIHLHVNLEDDDDSEHEDCSEESRVS